MCKTIQEQLECRPDVTDRPSFELMRRLELSSCARGGVDQAENQEDREERQEI